MRQVPLDNDSIDVHRPLGRFMLDEESISWNENQIGQCQVSFTGIEDIES
jgi:hypothetical protein